MSTSKFEARKAMFRHLRAALGQPATVDVRSLYADAVSRSGLLAKDIAALLDETDGSCLRHLARDDKRKDPGKNMARAYRIITGLAAITNELDRLERDNAPE